MKAKPLKLPVPEPFLQTRQSLLIRLKDLEDQESWHDFFHTYWKFIYLVAIRSGLTDAEAQDVVQEAIIDVSRRMPQFDYDPARGSFKGWLCQLTHWRIKDRLRQRQRDQQRHVSPGEDTDATDGMADIPDPDFVPPEEWNEDWERNLLDAAIQRVKARVRPIQFHMFDLYTLKEWPIQQVTAALGVSAGQVHLAKHRLTAQIEKEFRILEARQDGLRSTGNHKPAQATC